MICKCGKVATKSIYGIQSCLMQCIECFNAPKSYMQQLRELQLEANMRQMKILDQIDQK